MADFTKDEIETADTEGAKILADIAEIADRIDAECDALDKVEPVEDPNGEVPDGNRRYLALHLIALRIDALALRRAIRSIPEPEFRRREALLCAMAEKIGATIGSPVQ